MDDRTPKSRIRGMLRLMFVKSKERSVAMKRDKYSCCKCGIKRSTKKGFEQKIEVHHKKGVKIWGELIDLIYDQLLCDPDDLEVLCPNCHDREEQSPN